MLDAARAPRTRRRGRGPGRRQPGSATGACRSSTSTAATSRSQAPAGDLWLVGNGEVYNHEDVRASSRRRAFATRPTTRSRCTCSTSAGPAALDELNGMFAFVLAGEDGRFLAARDPVGIKPLYWAPARRQRALRLGDRRLRRRLAAARRGVPARPLLDAGARRSCASPAPSRRRRGRAAARAVWSDAPSRPTTRSPRPAEVLIALRRASDDGRRARRRVPVGRPRLDARRRDRARYLERARRAAADLRRRPVDCADLLAARVVAESPRHRAPRARLRRRARRSRRCRPSCARSSTSTRRWCAARCRTTCSPR